MALALSIARQGVGVAIAGPVRLGCLRVTALETSLPAMRFPVDVSGGVARFRHRRGRLERLEIALDGRAFESWIAPKLRGIVGARTPDVWLGVRGDGATVCVSESSDHPANADASDAVLAFDLHVVAEGEDLVVVVHDARGIGLAAHPHVLALACAGAALRGIAEPKGGVFRIRRPAHRIAAAILVDAGARVPSADSVRWNVVAADGDGWFGQAVRDLPEAPPSDAALREREFAFAVHAADDLLVTGQIEEARDAYLRLLENRPRHPGLVRRVLEIDVRAGGRTEAALSWTEEVSPPDSAEVALVRGSLLRELGDRSGALAAFERAAAGESAPVMAARVYTVAATCAGDTADAAAALDRAITRAPGLASARWARVEARLALGRIDEALADVQHVEALARGVKAKYAVWARAGRTWQRYGLHARADSIFERALRFVPDDPTALAGLAAALLGAHQAGRAAALLRHALDVAVERGEPAHGLAIQFAEVLGEHLDDLPAAVAHAASVPLDAAEAPIARGLEGRWRARLGDAVGASLAYARLREIAQAWAADEGDGQGGAQAATHASHRLVQRERVERMVELLGEAADFEATVRDELSIAQRTLAAALRLAPRDAALKEAYRALGARILMRAPKADSGPSPIGGEAPAPPGEPASHPGDPAPMALEPRETHDDDGDAARAARVEELVRRHHGDPSDEGIADELAALLEALDRGHELLALLSARLEDATGDRRAMLLPRVRSTLERMAAAAAAAGRGDEASLYRSALAALV